MSYWVVLYHCGWAQNESFPAHGALAPISLLLLEESRDCTVPIDVLWRHTGKVISSFHARWLNDPYGDEEAFDAITRACMVLADLDRAHRALASGWVGRPPVMDLLHQSHTPKQVMDAYCPSSSVRAALTAYAIGHLSQADEWPEAPAAPFPTFIGGSIVGGADGDLVLGDLLLELKTTSITNAVKRSDWLQVLAYALLDFDDRHHIRRLCVANLGRCGNPIRSLDEVLAELSGVERSLEDWRRLFRSHLEAAS